MRRGMLAALAALLLVASGCVRRGVQGDTSVYAMETWVIVATILGGLAAIPAGWVLRRTSARLGYGLLILGPVALVFFAPGMVVDRTRVDAEHFESSGIFGTHSYNVRFADLNAIQYVTERKFSGRRRRTDHYLVVTRKSGTAERIPLGTVLQEAAPEIMARAQQKGVTIGAEAGE